MNIYEFATEKEKQARELYLKLADKTQHEGMKKMLKMLADEDAKHLQK